MEATEIDNLTDTSKYRPKDIPIEKILSLRDKELSHSQIAMILGCNKSNVTTRLAGYKSRRAELDTFKEHQADVYADIQMRAIRYLTNDKLQKAPVNVLMPVIGIAFDKERLKRGESTTNLSVAGLVESNNARLEGISDDIARLTAELGTEE